MSTTVTVFHGSTRAMSLDMTADQAQKMLDSLNRADAVYTFAEPDGSVLHVPARAVTAIRVSAERAA